MRNHGRARGVAAMQLLPVIKDGEDVFRSNGLGCGQQGVPNIVGVGRDDYPRAMQPPKGGGRWKPP